jgi:hypothetical protein
MVYDFIDYLLTLIESAAVITSCVLRQLCNKTLNSGQGILRLNVMAIFVEKGDNQDERAE